MSHVNVRVPSFKGHSSRLLRLDNFSGGVRLKSLSDRLSDNQCPHLRNLIYSGDILRTRDGTVEAFGELPCDGELHSEYGIPFFGYRIFHIGTRLLAVSKTDRRVISDSLPDVRSFMVEMSSTLYIFSSNAEIRALDKSLTLSNIPLPEADYIVDAKNDLSKYTALELPDNMLTSRFTVTYIANTANGLSDFTLPTEPDTSYEISFLNTDTATPISVDYTVEGKVVTVSRKLYSNVKLTYTPKKGESVRHFDKIFGCTCAITYGGTGSGGTRVFFSGNPEYPGYYFYSDLLAPLSIPLLSYDILGNGSKSVSTMAKQRDDLIMLCTDSIYRISYTFDKSLGAEFTVSEISGTVGCDIPKSVRLVDNRLVFASSKGVHIIVSSDYTDELSVRSVSANIDGDEGFRISPDTPTCSIDYNRTYRLCLGSKVYVWDYGNTPYIASYDPATAERVLAWYILDGLETHSLFEEDGNLYGIVAKDGEKHFVLHTSTVATDLGTPISAELRTRDLDFAAPETTKTLTELHLTLLVCDSTPITVTVRADGRTILCEEILPDIISWEEDGTSESLARAVLQIPRCKAFRYSVGIGIEGGGMGVYGVTVIGE